MRHRRLKGQCPTTIRLVVSTLAMFLCSNSAVIRFANAFYRFICAAIAKIATWFYIFNHQSHASV